MTLAVTEPRRRPAPGVEPSRHLEVAPTRAQRRARPRLIHVLVTLGGVGVILFGQLLLSIALASGAYQVHALQAQQLDLNRTQDALNEKLDQYGSPQYLAAGAQQLGMVASGNPAYLDLSTGAVSGAPTPASGDLIGAGGDLVPNSLIDPNSIVTATGTPSAGAPAGDGGTGALPDGVIPSPTTH